MAGLIHRVASVLLAASIGAGSIDAMADVVLRDDRGVDIVLPAVPQRVISLLPSLTESVCAVGACGRLVGTDRFSNWPASVAALPKLGGLDDPQVERLVALKPDVVLLSSSARVIDRLEGLGLKVVVLETRDRDDVRRTLTLLGKMFASPLAADTVWARIERQIRAAAERVPPGLRGRRVYFEIDSTPYAAGPYSFIGELLARLGMGNAIGPELGPFPRLNPEYVVRAQPDIIMAPEQDLQDMSNRPGWSSLHALKRRQACGFGVQRYELVVRPGPRMGEAAGILADCLATLAARR